MIRKLPTSSRPVHPETLPWRIPEGYSQKIKNLKWDKRHDKARRTRVSFFRGIIIDDAMKASVP